MKIKFNQNNNLLIGLKYRSTSNRTSEYNNELKSFILANNLGDSHTLIMGNFYYPDSLIGQKKTKTNKQTNKNKTKQNKTKKRKKKDLNTKGDNINSQEYKFVETIEDIFLFQHITN